MELLVREPTAVLERWVNRYVQLESSHADPREIRITPNCHPYLTYSFHQKAELIKPGSSKITPPLFFSGLATHSDIRFTFSDRLGHFGVEFHPSAPFTLWKLDMRKLVNEIKPVQDQALGTALENTRGFDDRCQVVEKWLIKAVPEPKPERNLVEKAIADIHGRKGNIQVRDISRKYQLSRRHLSRLFIQQVGISTRQFITLSQIKWVYQLMHKKTLTVEDLSYAGGFYDPAHFIKIFRKVTNVNPSEFFENFDEFTRFYLAGKK